MLLTKESNKEDLVVFTDVSGGVNLRTKDCRTCCTRALQRGYYRWVWLG